MRFVESTTFERECKNIIEILDQELGILEFDGNCAEKILEEPIEESAFKFVEGE